MGGAGGVDDDSANDVVGLLVDGWGCAEGGGPSGIAMSGWSTKPCILGASVAGPIWCWWLPRWCWGPWWWECPKWWWPGPCPWWWWCCFPGGGKDFGKEFWRFESVVFNRSLKALRAICLKDRFNTRLDPGLEPLISAYRLRSISWGSTPGIDTVTDVKLVVELVRGGAGGRTQPTFKQHR